MKAARRQLLAGAAVAEDQQRVRGARDDVDATKGLGQRRAHDAVGRGVHRLGLERAHVVDSEEQALAHAQDRGRAQRAGLTQRRAVDECAVAAAAGVERQRRVAAREPFVTVELGEQIASDVDAARADPDRD